MKSARHREGARERGICQTALPIAGAPPPSCSPPAAAPVYRRSFIIVRPAMCLLQGGWCSDSERRGARGAAQRHSGDEKNRCYSHTCSARRQVSAARRSFSLVPALPIPAIANPIVHMCSKKRKARHAVNPKLLVA
jgi:hypothetical protein